MNEDKARAARRFKFYYYCRMTCLGGSEHGACACEKPEDCEMRFDPSYDKYRQLAEDRMVRYVKSVVET
jgi:hypothetical protein